jgi:hypothetical protein
MLITGIDQINKICPHHSCKTCNDAYTCNGDYEIEEDFYKGAVINRKFKREPECYRCFLINNIGIKTESLKIKIEPTISINLIQPIVKIEVIGEE